MLKITIPAIEQYDEERNEFTTSKEYTLQLEHSLVSISKWESKWLKPFLSKGEKTIEETVDYIKQMTITQNVPDDAYKLITNDNIVAVREYIDAPMTATTFAKNMGGSNREVITSEIIYYWMISSNIPFECQKWHLTRLITLINVCGIKSQPPKKMNKKEIAHRNTALNAERKRSMGGG